MGAKIADALVHRPGPRRRCYAPPGREAERRMESLSGEKEGLESRLADPAVYAGPTTALMQLQLRLGEVKSALAEAEKAWIEAHEEMEEAR